MPFELVRYHEGKPLVEAHLIADDFVLECDHCDAEYHIHYSHEETAGLSATRIEYLRTLAKKAVQKSHGGLASHRSSLPLEE